MAAGADPEENGDDPPDRPAAIPGRALKTRKFHWHIARVQRIADNGAAHVDPGDMPAEPREDNLRRTEVTPRPQG